MDIGTALRHYKKKDIQNEIIRCSSNKEVVGSYSGKGFAKRPDVLRYPNDIMELVKQGVTSFHFSEEIWHNPLQLEPTLRRKDIDALRKGWDLILDIDCQYLEYSKQAAYLLIEAIKHHGIKSLSCKFSGNHGFHIAIPFESFPNEVRNKETKTLFPEAPRAIAAYLQQMIKKHLAKRILELDSIDNIMKKMGKSFNDLTPKGEFDPFTILNIDTILISSRHLCRMPYSLNEKSWLVSIPIAPDKVLDFEKKQAQPDEVKVGSLRFLDRENVMPNEARQLLVQALDHNIKIEETKAGFNNYYEDIQHEAIPAELFPPCITKILNGLQDGRKRALFLLVNFLTSCGWEYDQIKELLKEWNQKNHEQLREVNILGQIRYHKQQKKKVLPPNCANAMYYKEIGICLPDPICNKIRNPVNYSKRKAFMLNQKKTSRKLTDEEKEQRKQIRDKRKKFKEEMLRKKGKGELL